MGVVGITGPEGGIGRMRTCEGHGWTKRAPPPGPWGDQKWRCLVPHELGSQQARDLQAVSTHLAQWTSWGGAGSPKRPHGGLRGPEGLCSSCRRRLQPRSPSGAPAGASRWTSARAGLPRPAAQPALLGPSGPPSRQARESCLEGGRLPGKAVPSRPEGALTPLRAQRLGHVLSLVGSQAPSLDMARGLQTGGPTPPGRWTPSPWRAPIVQHTTPSPAASLLPSSRPGH